MILNKERILSGWDSSEFAGGRISAACSHSNLWTYSSWVLPVDESVITFLCSYVCISVSFPVEKDHDHPYVEESREFMNGKLLRITWMAQVRYSSKESVAGHTRTQMSAIMLLLSEEKEECMELNIISGSQKPSYECTPTMLPAALVNKGCCGSQTISHCSCPKCAPWGDSGWSETGYWP